MKSKDKILNSLVKLMKHKVYEIITIKEIADNAGVNRSTFYRNFKIKEDIIKYGLEKIMDEFILEFKLIQDKTHQNYIYTISFMAHFFVRHLRTESFLSQISYRSLCIE